MARPIDIARAARAILATIDLDDLMIRAAVQDAADEDTLAELFTTITEFAVHYMREVRDDDTSRIELRQLLLDNTE